MPKNYTLDDILNEYSGEEKHKSAVKNKTAVKTEIKSNGQTGKIEDTGYIKIPDKRSGKKTVAQSQIGEISGCGYQQTERILHKFR